MDQSSWLFVLLLILKTLKKTLVKISLSSAVDPNSHDSEILKQLEEKFKEKNLNVKLSWKRGKDGKVFKKKKDEL